MRRRTLAAIVILAPVALVALFAAIHLLTPEVGNPRPDAPDED